MNKISSYIWQSFALTFPKMAARIMYRHIMGRNLNLNHPRDLNEKINYLKFHEDMDEWAHLADKYAVRKYVKDRGLEELLVPLYGKYDTPEEMMKDWNLFPKQFVVKTNHAGGTVKIVKNKEIEDKDKLSELLHQWMNLKWGIGTIEPHYRKIIPCIIVEKMLEDSTVHDFSRSMVDYKVWCFNGNPYCILTTYDRDLTIGHHHVCLDIYSTKWEKIKNALTDKADTKNIKINKPDNLSKLLEYTTILSRGHKQVRVDLYDIEGNIYFGEMTFTSQGGYMNYFTPDFLLELGNQFEV